MRKTRLFPTLVLFGASLTGGAVTTVATVSLAIVSGCDEPMSQGYPDIGVPRDMAIPRDISIGNYPDIGVPILLDMSKSD